LDAINRGPIQGDHIASKTDDAVDRRSALGWARRTDAFS
jgi:hypothetical protein